MYRDFFFTHQKTLEKNYAGITVDQFFDLFSSLPLKVFYAKKDEILDGTPIHHILGEKYFYKNTFLVNPGVLIPRSETEILVEKGLEEIKKNNYQDVLDIGCGSGCIGLSVLVDSRDSINLTLADISADALTVAKNNFEKLKYSFDPNHRVRFVESDLLENLSNEMFDIILTNPPYIKFSNDRSLVHEGTFRFEPHIALFLEDDHYNLWFKRFFAEIYSGLRPSGALLMEGHENHLKGLAQIAKDCGLRDVEILRDYTGRDRFISCKK